MAVRLPMSAKVPSSIPSHPQHQCCPEKGLVTSCLPTLRCTPWENSHGGNNLHDRQRLAMMWALPPSWRPEDVSTSSSPLLPSGTGVSNGAGSSSQMDCWQWNVSAEDAQSSPQACKGSSMPHRVVPVGWGKLAAGAECIRVGHLTGMTGATYQIQGECFSSLWA
jgi:hypothetical protein